MRCVCRLLVCGVVLALGFAGASGSGQAPGQVAVKVATYRELCDLVEANKGKVVVVDFWALTCIPCRRAFPHTVKMQQELADKGLAVISVATDSLAEERDATVKKVLNFLTTNKAAFPNLILDEPDQVLQGKLRIRQLPCIYVFNRAGKWRQFIGADLNADASGRYASVEDYVQSCLRESGPK
jgi:thiol-disulfide isomerase/thioredoxin